MDNQLENIKHLKHLLKPNGRIILSMPIKNYFYEKYGSSWYQLDAPRHFYLHTLKSFKLLLDTVGFNIDDFVSDANYGTFTKSEEYKNNIPSNDKRTYIEKWRIFFSITNLNVSIFNKKQIKEFKQKADELNEKKEGDHFIFLLKNLNSDND
jgi:hypothetical protein